MKKNSILLLFCIFLQIFAACSHEVESESFSSKQEEMEAVFDFTTQYTNIVSKSTTSSNNGSIEVTFGSAETKSTVLEEDVVSNMWALQFDDNGILIRKTYNTNVESYMGPYGFGYRSKFRLLVREHSTIHFVANINNSQLHTLTENISTLQDYFDLTHQFPNESSIVEGNGLPMSGEYEGAIPDESSQPVTLFRMVAKIELNVSVNLEPELIPTLLSTERSLQIQSVQLKNVPTIGTYYPNSEELYPNHSVETNFTDYAPEDISEDTPITWYIPENRRGINHSIMSPQDKYKETDPSFTDIGISRSTYIEIKTLYVSSNESRNISFYLYLGENTTDNFNIERDGYYHINVNIKKIENSDNRVDKEFHLIACYLDSYTYQSISPDIIKNYVKNTRIDSDILHKVNTMVNPDIYDQGYVFNEEMTTSSNTFPITMNNDQYVYLYYDPPGNDITNVTIEYYFEEWPIPPVLQDQITERIPIGEVVFGADYQRTYVGYVLQKIEPEQITAKESDDQNIIRLYYLRKIEVN